MASSSSSNRLRPRLTGWLAIIPPAAVVVLLEGASIAGLVNDLIVPRPSEVFSQVGTAFVHGGIGIDLAATAWRLLKGFTLALLVAVPLGIAAGMARSVDELSGLTVDFLRSLPATALIPAFVILFGIGEANKVAMVAFVVSLVLVVQLREGLRLAPSVPVETARIYGLSRWDQAMILTRLALPNFLRGVQVSVNLALVIVVVVEMFVGGGTRDGIGRRIFDAQLAFRVDEMWGAIVIVGLFGFVLAYSSRAMTRWLTPWTIEE